MAEGPLFSGTWLHLDASPHSVDQLELLPRLRESGGRGVLLAWDAVEDDALLHTVAGIAKEYDLAVGATVPLGTRDSVERRLSAFERVRKQNDFIVFDPVIGGDLDKEVADLAARYSGGLPGLVALHGAADEKLLARLIEVARALGPGGIVFYGAARIDSRGDAYVDPSLEAALGRLGRPSALMYVLNEDWQNLTRSSVRAMVFRLARGVAELGATGLVFPAEPLVSDKSLWEVIARLNDFPNNVPGPEAPKAGEPGEREDTRAARSAISDAATPDDYLGYDPYAQSIFEFITQGETGLPLSIAVSAPWGSGKTSLMQRIESELDEHRKDPERWKETGRNVFTRPCRTTWIPIWQYEGGAALWAAMTREIYQQIRPVGRMERLRFNLALGLGLRATDKWSIFRCLWWPRIALLLAASMATAGFFLTLALSDLNALGVAGGGTFGGLTAAALAWLGGAKGLLRWPFSVALKRFTEVTDSGDKPGKSMEAQEDIDHLIALATRDGHGLVVFVDDLDRCSPGRVVEAIEAINQLFAVGGTQTVFILGVDADMVAASIRVAYRDMVGELTRRRNPAGEDYGFRFLSKVVQMSFTIPSPRLPDIDTYLTHLLAPGSDGSETPAAAAEDAVKKFAGELEADAKTLSELRDQADARASSIEPSEWPAFNVAVAQQGASHLTFESPDVRQAIEFGAAMLEPRPRDIKRFVSAFRLQVLVSNRTVPYGASRATLHQIAKWTALHMRWPILAEEVKRRGSLLVELEKLAAKPKSKHPTGWSDRVKALAASGELMEILRQEPAIGGADLHGLLAVS